MTNQNNQMSMQEMELVKQRVSAIMQSMDPTLTLEQNLIAYAVNNGFSEEEAVNIVKSVVVETVDRYNDSCKAAMESGLDAWISDKIECRVDGMSLEQEASFKRNLIRAIYHFDGQCLSSDGMISPEAWDKIYDEYKNGTEVVETDVDQQRMSEINLELAQAITNSTFVKCHTELFAKMVDQQPDDATSVEINNPMWEDSSYKYVLATAAMVARRQGELNSISEDTPDESIVIGLCTGTDTERVMQQVARGRFTVDDAYNILKVVAGVALFLVGMYVVLKVGITAGIVAGVAVHSLIGAGIIGVLAGAVVGFLVMDKVSDAVIEAGTKFGILLNRVADLSFVMIKKAANTVHSFVCQTILPKAEEMLHRITSFAQRTFRRFTSQINSRTARC